jgi:DNA-binding MarR family transcriptional regulator
MAPLKNEIAQLRPFASLEEEAILNLLRSADALERAFHLRIRNWGLTSTQYNVLRILRGAGPEGLTCSAIGGRMITAVPDITRLLARLKAMKLIHQKRDERDRRVIWTTIGAAGLELLEQMNPVVSALPGEFLGHMNRKELNEFIRLLESARQAPATAAAK